MAVINPSADAERAFQVMKQGGIAILPNDVGYSSLQPTARRYAVSSTPNGERPPS